MLHIHNSMTGRKEPFKPIRPGEVRMYVCGITVYDYCHIGHGRMLIVFDLLRRHLAASRVIASPSCATSPTSTTRSSGARQENGEPIAALTERFIRAYQEDCAALGVAARRPRAEGDANTFRRSSTWWRGSIERGQRVSGRQRRRLFLGRELRALRPALRQAARGPARRRARRGRREQARPARLRAVEGGQARRARLGIALGARPSRLAHRVLGDSSRICAVATSRAASGLRSVSPHWPDSSSRRSSRARRGTSARASRTAPVGMRSSRLRAIPSAPSRPSRLPRSRRCSC